VPNTQGPRDGAKTKSFIELAKILLKEKLGYKLSASAEYSNDRASSLERCQWSPCSSIDASQLANTAATKHSFSLQPSGCLESGTQPSPVWQIKRLQLERLDPASTFEGEKWRSYRG